MRDFFQNPDILNRSVKYIYVNILKHAEKGQWTRIVNAMLSMPSQVTRDAHNHLVTHSCSELSINIP